MTDAEMILRGGTFWYRESKHSVSSLLEQRIYELREKFPTDAVVWPPYRPVAGFVPNDTVSTLGWKFYYGFHWRAGYIKHRARVLRAAFRRLRERAAWHVRMAWRRVTAWHFGFRLGGHTVAVYAGVTDSRRILGRHRTFPVKRVRVWRTTDMERART